jgi:hypothetical protein
VMAVLHLFCETFMVETLMEFSVLSI